MTIFAHSCAENQQKLLCKKWKTVALYNSKMQSELDFMLKYIDTLGSNDSELRQSVNLDSIKNLLRSELQVSEDEHRLALENTIMEFLPNGKTYSKSIDGEDSAMYTIEDNAIKIDEAKLKGYGETMTFDIIKLTKDSLKIRFINFGDTSLISLVPAL